MSLAVSVKYLQSLSISRLTLQEKISLKAAGRPTPHLSITQEAISNSRVYQRKFNSSIYSEVDWLCGCEISNALFCYPCLIFGGDKTWTITGHKDLKNIKSKIRKHAASSLHINRVIDLSLLGQCNIAAELDTGHALSVARHNDEVKKNRDTLSKIIDVIKLCGYFELPLRGHNETDDSENPGVFLGLIKYTSKFDVSLKAHLESGKAFKGTSKTIQNDILDSILEVCQAQIKEEINKSDFLAVMCDDTTDCFDKTQMVIVLRYELNGKPIERFWKFFNPANQTAIELSRILLDEMQVLVGNDHTKLIAQTYDGAATLSGARNGVQAIVKDTYPYAHFVHCYAHQLNLLLQKATSTNTNVRVFFNNLSGIPEFFSKSPLRMAALEAAAGRRIPRPSSTRWSFWSRTIKTVHALRLSIIECCHNLERSRATNTAFIAGGIKKILEDSDFQFWLNHFQQIMPQVEILFGQMQSRSINPMLAETYVKSFEDSIQRIRNSLDISVPGDASAGDGELQAKRRRNGNLTNEAKEVCDVVLTQCKERFRFTGHLIAVKLLQQSNFPLFAKQFPVEEFNEIIIHYPMLDKEKLKTELSVFYSRSDLNKFANITALMNQIKNGHLHVAFSELLKMLKIIVVTPMATAEAERCFSTLKRIKSFLRSTTGNDRLSALAMLSIEKGMIERIKDFNDLVVDHFATRKSRRMDFILK